MNNQRRKALSAIRDELTNIMSRLETIRDEEQDYFDNMPENLQDSEKGEKAQQAADNLATACDDLDNLLGLIEEAEQ